MKMPLITTISLSEVKLYAEKPYRGRWALCRSPVDYKHSLAKYYLYEKIALKIPRMTI